jgi:glycosyltransferase involved in cell wall biosynthesis
VDGIVRQYGVGTVCASLEEMVAAVRALTDSGASHAMRENARRLVRERFSPQVLGPRYVEFFTELVTT